MTVLQFAARFALGGIFLVFAADYAFHFLPELPFTDAGGRYLEALLRRDSCSPSSRALR